MQYLTVDKNMTLSNLSNIVGERNVDYVLNANSLERTVNIGGAFYSKIKSLSDANDTDYQKKLTLLNQFVGDSDLYEKAALGSEQDWNALATYSCFSDAIKIPDEVSIPSAVGVLGNSEPVSDRIYQACTKSLIEYHYVDPSIFAEYNATFSGGSYGVTSNGNKKIVGEPFQWFAIPWGEVCLYSSLSPNDLLYFPVYPKELDDGYRANYDEMSEMLYQYEPWKVYKSSGPRELSFEFEFHRDMWTGDHRDGNANALIRACQANCFPEYNGSLVNVPIVTLYIHGDNFITGVMTDCKVRWEGPIGLDGYYLKCTLSFTIEEVSPEPLNYTTVKNKGLIS